MPKIKPVFLGTVFKGNFTVAKLDNFKHYLTSLQYKTTPAKVTIKIERVRKTRSIKQHNYYFAYLNIIHQDCGQSVDDLHELFKRKFLPKRNVTAFGMIETLYGSTTKLSTVEFTDYIKRISELTEIPSPDPNEFYT